MGAIERFVAAALRQRFFVLLCLVALVATGVMAYRDLPVEAFPDLTNNQVVVVTDSPGLAATEVEQRVSSPIETAVMGVPGAEQVRSVSKAGLSIVSIIFDDAVPVYFARQLVNERMLEARSRIPDGLDPTLGPVATAFGEIYQYLMEGDSTDAMTKKTIHDWDIRTRLRSVRGVSEINSWGGETRQFQVLVDPRQLDRYALTLRQVFQALADNNATFGGGFIEHRSERYTVRGIGLAQSVDDLRNIVVSSVEGTPIYIRDVAEVSIGAMPRQGAVTRDGKGESVAGMVIMLKGENGKDVADRVKARMTDIEATLPAGLSIEPFYDQTEVIHRTAHTVRKNLLEGSLLVVIVLFVFLGDARAALLVAAVIPMSMLVGFIGMRYFGVSANLMSLGAIDFGLIVDGAVVMMENFVRRRGEYRPEPGADPAESRLALFSSAATEVARPILFGVLIIVAVYLPIFTLEGLEGKMFKPMAITVCSAILGSLLLSLTAVPVGASFLLKLGGGAHEGSWFERLRHFYTHHLAIQMNHRARTIGVALVAVTIAIGSLPFIGTEFMPKLDEGSILVETRKLPSVSLPESVAISTHVEAILRRFDEVKQVVTKLGRPDLATEVLDGSRRFDVVVRFPDAMRDNPEAIANLLLTAPGGERVPLGHLASVAMVRGPEAINHENGERRLVVQTNVRGRDVDSFVAEAQRRLEGRVTPPEGYHLAWGGQFENQQRAMQRLVLVIPLSLAIIFLLLFITFSNVRQAGLVILNVPFALVGGIGALWLRNLNLNLSASVGFIALFGVAVLNGVVMIAAINRLREDGLPPREAILEGGGTRLKPVLMTALVASLGFIPMAISSGAGSEIQRPLATVVIGGIVTSTLLTLIVLPTLYELIEGWVTRRKAAGGGCVEVGAGIGGTSWRKGQNAEGAGTNDVPTPGADTDL